MPCKTGLEARKCKLRARAAHFQGWYKPTCTGTMQEGAKLHELGLGSEVRNERVKGQQRVRAAAYYNIEP